jgi:hypothetical protein
MADAKTHTLNLTNGAVEGLKSVLGSAGWYDSAVQAYRAGQILEMPEMDLVAPPVAEAAVLWRNEPRALVLNEKQRETAKQCVEAFIKKGAFSINAHAMALMRELGLAPTE